MRRDSVPLTLVVSRARLGMSSNLLTGAPGGVQNLWLGLRTTARGPRAIWSGI